MTHQPVNYPRVMYGTYDIRCPHCGRLTFGRTDPDTFDRECRDCGFTGWCAVCGDPYDAEDSRWPQQCSDRCADDAAEGDAADRLYDARVERALEQEL